MVHLQLRIFIYLMSIYVNRIIKGQNYEKRIEVRNNNWNSDLLCFTASHLAETRGRGGGRGSGGQRGGKEKRKDHSTSCSGVQRWHVWYPPHVWCYFKTLANS